MAVLAFRRVLELRIRGKTIFEQSLKNVMEPVKESVTHDFSRIRDEAFQEMHGRDYEDQTDVARWIEDLARGILRELGLPTETEANLDLDVGELPGDPVDLFRAIWDEATGMMIWGLAASPFCARRILHLARAVEQWHETAGTNQLRRVALGSETGSSFTEMTEQGPTQVTEAFGTWTGDSVRNESSAGVRIEQLDVIEEETSEGSALLFCNEDERRAIVKEIQGASAPSTKEFNKGATEFVPGKPWKTPEVGKVAPEVASKSLRIDAAEFVPTVAARAAAEVPQATLPTPLFPVPQMPVPATLPFQDFGAAWTAQESKANGKTSNIAMKPDAQEFFPGVSAWAGAIVMPKQKAKAKAKASTARPRHPTSPGFIPSQPMSPGLQPTTRDADTAAPSLGSSGAVFAETPLHSLVSSPRCTLEAVEFLLHHGADVAARDKHNGTPLYLAAQWGHKEVVDLLIRHGADVAACDNYNKTPLHEAAMSGHKEVVDLLIQRGADVAARAKYLGTPLHFAADRGHKEVVDLLIRHGADVVARDTLNRTLLHLAAEWGHTEVVDLLIRHGADVAARDSCTTEPLFIGQLGMDTQKLLICSFGMELMLRPVTSTAEPLFIWQLKGATQKLLICSFDMELMLRPVTLSTEPFFIWQLNGATKKLLICSFDMELMLQPVTITTKPLFMWQPHVATKKLLICSFNVERMLRPVPSTSEPLFISQLTGATKKLLICSFNVELMLQPVAMKTEPLFMRQL